MALNTGQLQEAQAPETRGLGAIKLDELVAELALARPVTGNQHATRLDTYLAAPLRAEPYHMVRFCFAVSEADFTCSEGEVADAFYDVLPPGAHHMVWGVMTPAPLPMVELHAAGSYRAERRQRRVTVAPYAWACTWKA